MIFNKNNNEKICSYIRSNFSKNKAYGAQMIIRNKVILKDDFSRIRYIAGLDVAYRKGKEYDLGIGVAALLSYPSLDLVECVAVVRAICIPYIPGLLAFREMAVLAPALARLRSLHELDIVFVDGHGIAHPRGAGIATHVGVVFDLPSVGVAKKRLVGREIDENGKRYLVNDYGKKIATIIVKNNKKIYVSPGHKISLETAEKLARRLWIKGKIPEPTRVADHLTKEIKNKIINKLDTSFGYIECRYNRTRNIFS